MKMSDIATQLRELADACQNVHAKLFEAVDHCTVQEAHDRLRAALGKDKYFTIGMTVTCYSQESPPTVVWEIYVQEELGKGSNLRQDGPDLPNVLSKILILLKPDCQPEDALAAVDCTL